MVLAWPLAHRSRTPHCGSVRPASSTVPVANETYPRITPVQRTRKSTSGSPPALRLGSATIRHSSFHTSAGGVLLDEQPFTKASIAGTYNAFTLSVKNILCIFIQCFSIDCAGHTWPRSPTPLPVHAMPDQTESALPFRRLIGCRNRHSPVDRAPGATVREEP